MATLVLLLFQETVLLLAEAGPTPALSVSVLPFRSDAEDRPRLMTLTGILTVTLQEAFAPLPSLAVQVMVAVPLALNVTLPAELTVATFVLLLFHVTALFAAAAGDTVAFKVKVLPLFSETEVRLSAILATPRLTVILQEALAPPPSLAVQVIVAVPRLLAVTMPVAVTVATLVLLLFQVTAVFVASEGAAFAQSCTVLPFRSVAELLEIVIDLTFKIYRQGFSVIQLPRGIAICECMLLQNKCLQTRVLYDKMVIYKRCIEMYRVTIGSYRGNIPCVAVRT